jgi:hypothetical protein
MKTLIYLVMLCLSVSTFAQNSAVDGLFSKYSGTEGFTTVNVSTQLFDLLAKLEPEDEDLQKLASQISSVKVLASEGCSHDKNINFFDELEGQVNFGDFNELLTVKEKDQDVKMLVKETNGIINEFLLVVGGSENALVHITGNIDLKTLGELSDDLDIGQLAHLKKLEE